MYEYNTRDTCKNGQNYHNIESNTQLLWKSCESTQNLGNVYIECNTLDTYTTETGTAPGFTLGEHNVI